MSFLESIGLASSPRVIPKTPAPEPNGKKSGTPAYKYSLVYIYCDVADHERAKMLAKELGIPMKVLIHRLLFAAEIAVPNKTKVTVLNGKAFWEMFDVPGLKEPVEEKFK